MINNKKQWFLLVVAPLWLCVPSAVVFSITRDSLSFSLVAPMSGLLYLLIRKIFPPTPEEYELQKLKLRLKLEAAQKKKRKPP